MTGPFSPERIADRLEIQDLLYRVAFAVDRKDYAALERCYHADAHENHGVYVGDVPGFVAFVKKRHVNIDVSFHNIGNFTIDFIDNDRALVESSCITFQVIQSDDPAKEPTEVMSANRYVDIFSRRDARWAIQERHVVAETARISESQRSLFPLALQVEQARRDENDLSLVMRRKHLGSGPA